MTTINPIPTGGEIKNLVKKKASRLHLWDTSLLINWLYQFHARAWQEGNTKELSKISGLIGKIAKASVLVSHAT